MAAEGQWSRLTLSIADQVDLFEQKQAASGIGLTIVVNAVVVQDEM